MSKKHSVLLIDDHQLVLRGLRDSLAEQRRIEVIGEARDGISAVEMARELQPDVIVMDISMPKKTAFEAVPELRKVAPEARIVIMTMYESDHFAHEFDLLGVWAYLLKSASPQELIDAILSTERIESTFPHGERCSAWSNGPGDGKVRGASPAVLSPREREVLVSVAKGQSTKQVAADLHISDRTVETYRARLSSKLGLHGPADCASYAITWGMIEGTSTESTKES